MAFNLTQDNILPALQAHNRKELLRIIIQHAAENTGLSAKDIHEAMFFQENKAISGVGNGIALPNARVIGLDEPYMLFARLPQAIDYMALDDQAVDLVTLLLSPAEEPEPFHLRRLARLTRAMRDQNLCKRLRGADRIEALYVLLMDPVEKSLAA